MLFYLHKNEKQ